MEVIENFLDDKVFQDIKKIMMSNLFPWYYNKGIINKDDTTAFMFTHTFFNDSKSNSRFFDEIILPMCGVLNFKTLRRAKANCYVKNTKEIIHKFHVDDEEPHTVALFSINSNNGYTEFKGNKKIFSEENRMVIFNGDTYHRSVTQTDENLRVNINFNLIN